MRPRVKLALAIAGLVAYTSAGVAIFVVGLWSGLDAGERSVVGGAFRDELAFTVGAAVLFVLGLGALAAVFFTRYVRAPTRLTEEVKLIGLVNPSHRLAPTGPKEFRELAVAINDLADRYERSHDAAEARARRATEDLEREARRLAGVVAHVTQAVLVCDGEGRILLYNDAARRLLGEAHEGERGDAESPPVGLGRSVFGVLDPNVVRPAVGEIRRRAARGDPSPVTRLALEAGGRQLHGHASPIREPSDPLDAFVLVLDDAGSLDRAPAPAAPGRPLFYDFDLFELARRRPDWDERLLAELVFTAFDLETTGLDPADDEIVAIGAVRIANGSLLREEVFHQLVDPRRAISLESVEVHGISPWMVAGEPTSAEVLPRFARFAHDSVLVGHNVGFDLRFLERSGSAAGVRFAQPVLDTLLLSAVVHPNQEDHSIEAIAARLGLQVVGRHTALGDAILAGEAFLGLIPLLSEQGVLTLADALAASQATDFAKIAY
jgi:DNA polymerase III subunit epsilon